MIAIEMLPAERGDSILIEYGEASDTTHRVLIDGGPANSGQYGRIRDRLRRVPTAADRRRHFDLLIVTHVDSDHIEGVIRLLQDVELRCVFDDIWFNGWKHLEALEPDASVSMLGPTEGEFLGALLRKQGRPWNQYFQGGAIYTDGLTLPTCTLQGGLELTVLSPTIDGLKRLAREWEVAVRQAGFEPGDVDQVLRQLEDVWWARPPLLGDDDRIRASSDRSAANGSSIAVLAEWHGDRRFLLVGDAHDDVLTAALQRLRSERSLGGPLPVDAFKLSHHGSEHNTTTQLLAELSADQYLVSTSGDRFGHPDALAIRTVLDHHNGPRQPVLCCNYEQDQTTMWRSEPDVEIRFGDAARLFFD